MAKMKKCPQCAESVLAEAKICRYCGSQFPEPPPKPVRQADPKQAKQVFWVIAGLLIGLPLVGAIFSHPPAPPTPAEQAAADLKEKEAKTEKENSGLRFTRATAAKLALFSSLRDPESLSLDDVRASDKGDLVCIEYRARNGFGGMNQEFIAYDAAGKPHQSATYWNGHCRKDLYYVK